MSGKKSPFPDGRIPDRLPDGRPAVPWKSSPDRRSSSSLVSCYCRRNGRIIRRRIVFLRVLHGCGIRIKRNKNQPHHFLKALTTRRELFNV